MKIVKYDEAVDLVMHGGREDICLMIPQPMDKLPMREVRKLAEGGAVFAVMPEEEPESPKEEPQSSSAKKPLPKPVWEPSGEANTGPDPAEQEEKPDKKRRVKLDTGKVMALHNNGWSNRKIADEMGCSEGIIWNCLKKMENQIKEDKKQ